MKETIPVRYFDYATQNPTDLHVHLANNLVMTARTWQPEIALEKGEKTANPKSPMPVLTLNVNQGNTIRITATSVDEGEATAGMKEFVKENL